jgi:hypothetical protein
VSPQASSPKAKAVSAAFSTSSTRRPSTWLSVESEVSTRMAIARSRARLQAAV